MIQGNYFTTNEDILLHFNTLIDWNEIIEAYEHGFKDSKIFKETGNDLYANAPSSVDEAIDYYRTILDTMGSVTGNYVSQLVREMDKEKLKFENGKIHYPKALIDSVNKLKETGLMPYGFRRKFGGLGIPFIVRTFLGEILYRTDGSAGITFACANLAEILENIASEEMQNEWLPRIAAGEFTVSMGLTEPDHGSDLPNIRTRATKKEDGTWILNGTKRFITQAAGFENTQGIILTLARTGEEGSGARGLSFFLVQSKHIQVLSIESKLGLHCSPTCEVIMEDTPGLLIGKEGLGLIRYTMGMLNGARMGVASQGTGLATAAYEEAKKYASQRIQFGKPLNELGAIKKILDRMEREILGMRCLMVEGSRMVDLYLWKAEHLKEEGIPEREVSRNESLKYWEKMAGIYTPISKFFCAEMCNKIAYDALQIHGGSGFTEEYDIARIYRDARITSIYDGTSQIQVMAAIGGIVSGMSLNGQFRDYVTKQMNAINASPKLNNLFKILEKTVIEYKNISPELKEGFATEVVESAARFLCSLLLEKSLVPLADEKYAKRREHTGEYLIDSIAIAEGNLYRIAAKR